MGSIRLHVIPLGAALRGLERPPRGTDVSFHETRAPLQVAVGAIFGHLGKPACGLHLNGGGPVRVVVGDDGLLSLRVRE